MRAELLELVLRSFNPLFLAIALLVGVVLGFSVGMVAVLEGMAQVVGLAALVVLSLLLWGIPLIPVVTGYVVLLVYQRWPHRLEKLALLTLVLGIAVGYIPWEMNSTSYPEAVHSTNRYAQSHNLAPYRVGVNWIDSGSSQTEIHLSDGTVLICTLQTFNFDLIECGE